MLEMISDYVLQASPPQTPQRSITFEPQSSQEPMRRIYQLEDGFIPIVTNHGSAILANPDQSGHQLNILSEGDSSAIL